MRYFNDAVTGIEILYREAVGGSGTAREILKDIADRLVRAAGRYRRWE